ncbi:PDR/VanB family oxidoreductase [Kitasatospora purpeofusca]|uniref:PDR/VanB family oxidoreductase n=1 Tax=Kitasatospora purpeofusca TaxID=67352 RepID=UPI0033DF376E
MQQHMVLVSYIEKLSNDILGFTLASATGRPLPEFQAGAHIDVHLPNGACRQYSLCNTYEKNGTYQIAVKLEPASRGGSVFLHESIAEGDILQIGSPKNLFSLDPRARHALLLAGGIGVTPILSMARHLSADGEPFTFEYFVRSREDAAFLDTLEEDPALRANTNLAIGLTPEETTSRLTEILADQVAGTHVYVCGPGPFVSAARKAAEHWSSGSVHFESFSAAEFQHTGQDEEFEVVLAKTGRTLKVRDDQTIADTLKAEGVSVETSCGQGICGTCRTEVLAGSPDHRDMILSDSEKESRAVMMVCVSRAAGGTLVLDL